MKPGFRKTILHMVVALFLLMTGGAMSQTKNKTTLYFFWGNGCPHCNKEKIFLGHLGGKYPELEVKSYEVWYDLENAGLFAQISKAYGKKIEGVPMVFIGNFDPVVGYISDEVTGKVLEEKILYCIENGCADPFDRIRRTAEEKEELKGEARKPAEVKQQPKGPVPDMASKKEEKAKEKIPQKEKPPIEEELLRAAPSAGKAELSPEDADIVLPLLGAIDTSKTSLPILTVVIAGMDGFNPCAFFVLFLLLSILIYARSRKIMLLIGGTFVFFSGFIYFLFMAAWLNLFLLFGQLKIITVVAGATAVLIALINIKDFFFFKTGVSLTIPEAAKPKLFERTRGLLKKSSLASMMFGTVVLAMAANSYELLCTAGFPMVYTRALTLHHLPTFQYYLYLLFYNVVYVIPLAAIVVTVSITLGTKKMTEWRGQVLKLVSGIMMFYLGLVLLVRPSLLSNILISAGLLVLSLVTTGIIVLATKHIRKGKAVS